MESIHHRRWLGDTLLIGSQDFFVYALDASNGAVRWKYETGLGVSASPAVSGDVVVIGSKDGKLYALEVSTGKLRWKVRAGEVITGPAVFGDSTIYIQSWGLQTLDPNDGKSDVARGAGHRSTECAGDRGTDAVPDEQRRRSVCVGIGRSRQLGYWHGFRWYLRALPKRRRRWSTRRKYSMGTVYEIAAYDESPEHAAQAIDQAFAEIVRLDGMLSNYKPESDLSRLNRDGHFHAVKSAGGFVPCD